MKEARFCYVSPEKGVRFCVQMAVRWSLAFVGVLCCIAGERAAGESGSEQIRSDEVRRQFGARGSALYQMLEEGHHDVKLSEEDFHRITLRLDCNSDFSGSYENTEAQARGQDDI